MVGFRSLLANRTQQRGGSGAQKSEARHRTQVNGSFQWLRTSIHLGTIQPVMTRIRKRANTISKPGFACEFCEHRAFRDATKKQASVTAAARCAGWCVEAHRARTVTLTRRAAPLRASPPICLQSPRASQRAHIPAYLLQYRSESQRSRQGQVDNVKGYRAVQKDRPTCLGRQIFTPPS